MVKRILVVDDEEHIRTILAHFLREDGFEVLTAADGDDALFLAHMQRPDAIVLDVLMPAMDGFDVCTMLQGHDDTRDIPIIFLTGMDDPHGRLKARYFGGMEYVKKPFRKADVVDALHRVLGGAPA